MSDPDRLAEIRQRRMTITPPPWRWGDWQVTFGHPEQQRWHLERSPAHGDFPAPARLRGDDGVEVLPGLEDPIEEYPELVANAEFIAHAPADIDYLVSEVERLREVVKRLEFDLDQEFRISSDPPRRSEALPPST